MVRFKETSTVTQHSFKVGALYQAKDGRKVYYLTAINDSYDIWEFVDFKTRNRIGVMSGSEFAALIGRD